MKTLLKFYDSLSSEDVKKILYHEASNVYTDDTTHPFHKNYSTSTLGEDWGKNSTVLNRSMGSIESIFKKKRFRNNLVFAFFFLSIFLFAFSLCFLLFDSNNILNLENIALLKAGSSTVLVFLSGTLGLLYKSENRRLESTEKDLRKFYIMSSYYEVIKGNENEELKIILAKKLDILLSSSTV